MGKVIKFNGNNSRELKSKNNKMKDRSVNLILSELNIVGHVYYILFSARGNGMYY